MNKHFVTLLCTVCPIPNFFYSYLFFFFCLSHFKRLPILDPFFLSVITFSCIFLHSIPLNPLFLLTRSLFIIFPIIFLLTPLLFIPYSSSSSSPFHSYIHLYFDQSNLHFFFLFVTNIPNNFFLLALLFLFILPY